MANQRPENVASLMPTNRSFIPVQYSKNRNFKDCIKILYKNKKFWLILSNKGLTKAGSDFCTFCVKSFVGIKTHLCFQSKCSACWRYTFKNEYNQSFCKEKDETFESKSCENCNKIMFNHECFETHKALKSADCQHIKVCPHCTKQYTKKHICNEHRCRFCFEFHKKSDFCQLSAKKCHNETYRNFFWTKIGDYAIFSSLEEQLCDYTYIFNLRKNKVWIFESIQKSESICILEEHCYATNFREFMIFLNINTSTNRSLFVCDSEMFQFIKDNLTNSELRKTKIQSNDNRVEYLLIGKSEIVDMNKIIPLNYHAMFLSVCDSEPHLNPLLCHYPGCVNNHGHKNLQLKCFLSTINCTSKKLFDRISNAKSELGGIKNLSELDYMSQLFKQRLYLIREFIGK